VGLCLSLNSRLPKSISFVEKLTFGGLCILEIYSSPGIHLNFSTSHELVISNLPVYYVYDHEHYMHKGKYGRESQDPSYLHTPLAGTLTASTPALGRRTPP